MSVQIPLSVQDLSVGFSKPIFEKLNIEIQEKEFVTLMGENGVGKTTLIDTLMGYRSPYTGIVRFWGEEFSGDLRATINQKVGWVISHPEIYPAGLSIEGLLTSIKGLYSAWDNSLELKLANAFNLDLRKKLTHLSLGERSKVKLIKAIAFRPQLLVLDELTANLSQESKQAILEVLIDLFANSQMAILYISHSKDEALKLSDRVVYLTPSGLSSERGIKNA
jgi:ABC-2 type transport system ATP-binding protein